MSAIFVFTYLMGLLSVSLACFAGDINNYDGMVANTATGRRCQRWDTNTPHTKWPKYNPSADNYCRYTDDTVLPWCYTTDHKKRWEHCHIPDCSCEPDWTFNYDNSMCYKLQQRSFVSFDVAITGSKRLSAKLAMARNKRENDLLQMMSESSKYTIWLGATDRGKEGIWVWNNGNVVTWSNWEIDEPSNSQNREDCLTLVHTRKGQWNDKPCGEKRHYIAMKRGLPISTRRACENRHIGIKCRRGHVIKVKYADFGRTRWGVCKDGKYIDNHCRSPKGLVLTFVRGKCDLRNSCRIKSSYKIFGDPCPKVQKYTEIQYQCVPGVGTRGRSSSRQISPLGQFWPAHQISSPHGQFSPANQMPSPHGQFPTANQISPPRDTWSKRRISSSGQFSPAHEMSLYRQTSSGRFMGGNPAYVNTGRNHVAGRNPYRGRTNAQMLKLARMIAVIRNQMARARARQHVPQDH